MEKLIEELKNQFEKLKTNFKKSKEKAFEVDNINQSIRSKCWHLNEEEIRKEIEKIDRIDEDNAKNFKQLNKFMNSTYIEVSLVFFVIVSLATGIFDLMLLIQILLRTGILICTTGFITESIHWIMDTKNQYLKDAHENELQKRIKFEFLKSKQEYDNKQEIETYEPVKSFEDEKDDTKTK